VPGARDQLDYLVVNPLRWWIRNIQPSAAIEQPGKVTVKEPRCAIAHGDGLEQPVSVCQTTIVSLYDVIELSIYQPGLHTIPA